jgi:predicted transcriptional regulator
MSPRAACRLQTLGFTRVYDYVLGKADWLAHGLPTEGEQASVPRAKDLLRQDVATAQLDEPIRDVRQRVARSPYGFALVLTQDRTLLGRLGKAVLEGNPDAAAQQVMEPGPATVRPDRQLADLLEPMRTHNLQAMVVTTPEGRLLGVLRRDDAERRLAEPVAPDR